MVLSTVSETVYSYQRHIVFGIMNCRAPKNIHFECQRCARCCGDTSHRGRNVLLTKGEVERISKRISQRPLSFASSYSNSGHYQYKMKKRSGKCIFLDGKACRIYDTRPLICRFYPFSMRKSNGSYVFETAEECPGIGLGGTVVQGEFKKMISAAHSVLKPS